jgi:hypothetical protein
VPAAPFVDFTKNIGHLFHKIRIINAGGKSDDQQLSWSTAMSIVGNP